MTSETGLIDDTIMMLAQKLYTEDGYQGNLYKSDKATIYEAKAIKIIEKENNG